MTICEGKKPLPQCSDQKAIPLQQWTKIEICEFHDDNCLVLLLQNYVFFEISKRGKMLSHLFANDLYGQQFGAAH